MRTLLLGILAVFIFKVNGLETTEVTSCDSFLCNHTCIAALHWSGHCQDGQCWCWRSAKAAIIGLEKASGYEVNPPGLEVGECNDETCDTFCSPFRGHCGAGVCWCWWWKNKGQLEKRVQKVLLPTSSAIGSFCNTTTCDETCIALRWDVGSCKDGLCWCGKYEKSRRVTKLLSELTPPADSCNDLQCNRACIAIGWDEGHCKDGQCWCYRSATSGTSQLKLSSSLPEKKSSWRLLNPIPNNFRDIEGHNIASCTLHGTCLDACKKENATDGFCLKGLCWCSMINETTVTKYLRPIIELQANISDAVTSTCNPNKCRIECNNNGKTGGAACIHGYCWCTKQREIQRLQSRERLSNIMDERENII